MSGLLNALAAYPHFLAILLLAFTLIFQGVYVYVLEIGIDVVNENVIRRLASSTTVSWLQCTPFCNS